MLASAVSRSIRSAMLRLPRILTLCFVTAFVPAPARAGQGPAGDPIELTRLPAPITVDGRLDDPAWQQVPTLPLTMYAPLFRGTPTQRTEIRVAYDDEYFYVAGWFYDTDPSGIRVNSLYRDRWNGDDALAIYIDAFNDNQNAKWFGTTPAGMRFDLLVSDDGEHEQRELGQLLDLEDDGHRGRLVRRSAHPVLEPRLPGRRGRPRGDGPDRDPARIADRRARDLPGDRSEVPVPPALGRPGRRLARRPQPDAALPHPLRARRRLAQLRAGSRRLFRRERETDKETRHRRALSAVRQLDARSHREHRLRAGGG